MASSAGPTMISSVNFYSFESNPTTALGSLAYTQDGRKFRYALAGATALVQGTLQQSQTEQTNFKDMSVQAAVAVGATTVPVTLGSTATTQGATTSGNLVGGLLVVSAGTSMIGQYSRILSHDTASASTTCNFVLEDPIAVALTTSGLVTCYPHMYRLVVQHLGSATNTGLSTGVPVYPVAANKYGWLQTGGLGACLSDATVTTAAIQAMSPSVGTAGALTKAITLNEVVANSLPAVSVSARVEPVVFHID